MSEPIDIAYMTEILNFLSWSLFVDHEKSVKIGRWLIEEASPDFIGKLMNARVGINVTFPWICHVYWYLELAFEEMTNVWWDFDRGIYHKSWLSLDFRYFVNVGFILKRLFLTIKSKS